MAIYEHNILMRDVDEKGNMHINYPRTKAKNVIDENHNTLGDILKNIAYLAPKDEESGELEDNPMINADLLDGKSFKDIEELIKSSSGGVIDIPEEDLNPNSIMYINSEKKVSTIEVPEEDSILIFSSGKPMWITFAELQIILKILLDLE